ncbi:hypothetical protein [Runella sp.]|uniref:hypothetical protein n=1 Tax=Runella sp. TaxID=1960881 RepID=UPI003D12309C
MALEIIKYFTLYDIFYYPWFNITIFIIQLALVVYYAFVIFNMRKQKFRIKYFYSFFTLTFFSILMIGFHLFLHEYIDKNYKEVLADKDIEILHKALDDYAVKHHVEMEDNSKEDIEVRTKILNQYSISGLFSSLLFNLVANSFLSYLIALLIVRVPEIEKK